MFLYAWTILFASVVFAQGGSSDPLFNKRVKDLKQHGSRVGSVKEAERLFNFAGLTYCKDNVTRIGGAKYTSGMGDGFQVKLMFENVVVQTRGLLAIDHKRKQILLGFRGTTSLVNWGANIIFNRRRFKHGQVHEGFKNLVDLTLPKYWNELMKLVKTYPNYRLVIVGHSLGGAMAVLSAVHLADVVPWKRISVYTYGQPRVGDRRFVMWLNSQPLEMTRVVNDNDGIPHMPPNFAGFFHAHTEMFIRNRKVVICSTETLEDPNCSMSLITLPSSAAHSIAFGTKLDTAYCRFSYQKAQQFHAMERRRKQQEEQRRREEEQRLQQRRRRNQSQRY